MHTFETRADRLSKIFQIHWTSCQQKTTLRCCRETGMLWNRMQVKPIYLATKPNLPGRLVFPSFVHSTIMVLELQLLLRWTCSTCILVPLPVTEDPVSAMEMSSAPSTELLAICVGEEWGGVGLQSMGSPVTTPLPSGEIDFVDSLQMTCNSTLPMQTWSFFLVLEGGWGGGGSGDHKIII
jgi:hypothetical protein